MPAHFTKLRSLAFDWHYLAEHRADGLDYLHCGDWQKNFAQQLVSAFDLAGLPILDAGTAAGSTANALAASGALTWACDISEAMIAAGRRKFYDHHPRQVLRLDVCDCANLHLYRANQFAFVQSVQSAEHWHPALVPSIMREFYRVARPGAALLLILDTTHTARRQQRDLATEDPTHQTIAPPTFWIEAAIAAGWKWRTPDGRGQSMMNLALSLDLHEDQWLCFTKAGRLDTSDRLTFDTQHQLWHRAAQPAAQQDLDIFREVIDGDTYHIRGRPHPAYVLDIGAHIGTYTAAANSGLQNFACIEANPGNLLALDCNVGQFAKIFCPAAAWYEPERPRLLSTLHPGGLSTGGSQTRPSAEARRALEEWENAAEYEISFTAPPPITLEEIRAQLDWPRFDQIKIDCEGAEWQILRNCDLRPIREIVGEYHGELRHQETHGTAQLVRLLRDRFPPAEWQFEQLRRGEIGTFRLTRKK